MASPTIKDVYDLINDFRLEVKGTYVTKDEFAPVKAISFGIVGIIVTTILGIMLSGVVKAQ